MEGEDFLDKDVLSSVKRFEKMIRNKTQDYFDSETIESIAEYYIVKDKLKKALEAVYYGESLYPYYTGFKFKKAEVFLELEKFEDAIEELEKFELYEPFNSELLL